MSGTPIALVSTRPLGPDWPAIRKWKVFDEDGIDGVELKNLQIPGETALAHRATSGEYRWQVTWFDDRGPGGDTRRHTLEEALNYAAPPTTHAITAIHLKGERMTSNPGVPADKYGVAIDDAVRWTRGAPITRSLRPFMDAVPRDGFDRTLDREFWLGEIFNDMRASIERDPEITHGRRAYLMNMIDDRIQTAIRERSRPRRNPATAPPGDAIDKYREFHRKDPKRIGEFARGFAIPTHVVEIGDAKNVLYRSDKIDPETLEQPERPINYIHDHDPGVSVYEPCHPEDDDAVEVPYWITECEALVLLGTCLGFAFQPDGGELVEGRVRAPRPELYTTPDGRALLVVQSKRRVLVMMWGGSLGVEDRGIVG